MRTSIDLRLARHGAILLLLGLLTGFVIGNFHSRNIGNAAHLTGLIGGYGLIAVGLLWPKLNLRRSLSAAGAWITAASAYLNWLGLVLKDGFATPFVWGRAGDIVLTMAVLLSLLSVVVVLIGLRKLAAPADTESVLSAMIATKD
jgi:hypothetical protein